MLLHSYEKMTLLIHMKLGHANSSINMKFIRNERRQLIVRCMNWIAVISWKKVLLNLSWLCEIG